MTSWYVHPHDLLAEPWEALDPSDLPVEVVLRGVADAMVAAIEHALETTEWGDDFEAEIRAALGNYHKEVDE